MHTTSKDSRQGTPPALKLSSPKSTKPQLFFDRVRPLSKPERAAIGAELTRRAMEHQGTGYMARQRYGQQLADEAERFCKCGTEFQMWLCAEHGKFRSPVSCNSRICDRCGRRYFRRYQDAIRSELDPLFANARRGWGVFLLTLTTNTARYAGLPTRKDIARFYKETGRFFRLTYGKHYARVTAKGEIIEDARRHHWTRDEHGRRVRERRQPRSRTDKNGKTVTDWRRYKGCGYITTIELGTQLTHTGKLNNNLHCHALVYGPYISQKELANRWWSITGDSYVVDIRKVNSPKAATSYVLKYISKPPAVRTPAVLADYVETIKGTRRLRSGGIFAGKMKRRTVEKLPFGCPYCAGHLENSGRQVLHDLESHDSQPLYPLQRPPGSDPPPVGIHRSGLMDEVYAAAAQWSKDNLQFADKPLSFADLQAGADLC